MFYRLTRYDIQNIYYNCCCSWVLFSPKYDTSTTPACVLVWGWAVLKRHTATVEYNNRQQRDKISAATVPLSYNCFHEGSWVLQTYAGYANSCRIILVWEISTDGMLWPKKLFHRVVGVGNYPTLKKLNFFVSRCWGGECLKSYIFFRAWVSTSSTASGFTLWGIDVVGEQA